MYGMFTYIYHKNELNVGKYAIHESYGNVSAHSLRFKKKIICGCRSPSKYVYRNYFCQALPQFNPSFPTKNTHKKHVSKNMPLPKTVSLSFFPTHPEKKTHPREKKRPIPSHSLQKHHLYTGLPPPLRPSPRPMYFHCVSWMDISESNLAHKTPGRCAGERNATPFPVAKNGTLSTKLPWDFQTGMRYT